MSAQMKLVPVSRKPKIQSSHAQFLRLYKWADAHSGELSAKTIDEARAAAVAALQFEVAENAMREVATEIGIEYKRRAIASKAPMSFENAQRRSSRILASALLHVFSELDLRTDAAGTHRALLEVLAKGQKVAPGEGI